MYSISKISWLKSNYFNLALALMPFSFIAGNMVININVILIIISTLVIFNKKLLKIKLHLLDWLIIAFFSLIIFTALINDLFVLNKLFWGTNFATTLRSFLFLKYILFYFILRFLVENNCVNLKFFYFSCFFSSTFVCLDIIYQFIFGVDIFGYKKIPDFRKLAGPFGDEYIAGGFIQRFSIFSFFILSILNINRKRYLKVFSYLFLSILFFVGIVLSGNRMPLLLFLLCLVLVFISQKEFRKYFFSLIILTSLAFYALFNFNHEIKSNFKNFYSQINGIIKTVIKDDASVKASHTYIKEFSSFYETWKLNKYIGGGIKSFRFYCHVRDNIDPNSKFICNMHPHNYYLEILTETGIAGLVLVVSIIITLSISLKKNFSYKQKKKYNDYLSPFIILFFVEIFPLKSTGSFFTTGNTTYLILIMSILVALIRKENLIENKS